MNSINTEPFIITVTGPSQSGKSLVLNKIEKLALYLKKEGCRFFKPVRVVKETTRDLRVNEIEAIESGKAIDVKHVPKISDECDLVYQTYGVRYGISTAYLKDLLDEGKSPYVVVNDIRAVEELKKVFPKKVLSLFLFRKIPDLIDFQNEAIHRGNVKETEIKERYEKAISIYRMYIENIALFDRVIINAVEYNEDELNKLGKNNLDKQLLNIFRGVFSGQIKLRLNSSVLHSEIPKTFIIAGNSASGKDELVRAIQNLGKLQAEIIPKYTVRIQEKDDDNEMICRLKPNEDLVKNFEKAYQQELAKIDEELNKVPNDFRQNHLKEWEEMRTKIISKVKTGIERFWDEVKQDEDKSNIEEKYFEENNVYINLFDIKNNGKILLNNEQDGTILVEYNDKKYIIYHPLNNENKLYGFELKKTEKNKKYHIVVASNFGVFDILKKYLNQDENDDNVIVVYSHSQISASDYQNNSDDITAIEKVKNFNKYLADYVNNIAYYNHVVIYARSKLKNDKSIDEEELIDQMFRLFRVY